MSRPKPTVLMSALQSNDTSLEVCEASGVYAIAYRGRPVKIRTRQKDMYDGYKYGKSSFPEPGHAINLARKLNQLFNTDEFSVIHYTVGKVYNMYL